MKKALAVFLSLLLLISGACIPQILAAAQTPENLAADYTYANGSLSYNTLADSWGSSYRDNRDDALYGGYSWTFGLSDTNATDLGEIYIKASGLRANTVYQFVFYYRKHYIIKFFSALKEDGTSVTDIRNEDLYESGTTHCVTTEFTTDSAGDYTITLKSSKAWYNPQSDSSMWAVILSDLKLYQLEDYTLAEPGENPAGDYTYANGGISWNSLADSWGGSYNDNKQNSVEGGYSWTFGLANTSATDLGEIYIHAKGLKANTTYRFSYIFSGHYEIRLKDVADPFLKTLANVKTDTVGIAQGAGGHRVTVEFITLSAGNYTITLQSSKTWQNRDDSGSAWNVVLSDLVLNELEENANLAANYTKANGNVTWNSLASNWGSRWTDSQADAIDGGLSWTFGCDNTNATSLAEVYIKATDLKANTNYCFSWIYNGHFKILLKGLTVPNGLALSDLSVSDTAVGRGNGAHRVSVSFTTGVAGDYIFTLQSSKDNAWRNPDASANWMTILSDLQLIELLANGNLAAGYTYYNKNVSWTNLAGDWGKNSRDNRSNSVNGGYSWTFGLADTSTDDIADITIRTTSLKANTKYRFSYLYQYNYIIKFAGVNTPAGVGLSGITANDQALDGGDGIHEVSFDFTTQEAGVYTITLQTTKAWRNPDGSNTTWKVVLSDLCLIENPVLFMVNKARGGSISAGTSGYVRKGSGIELTAQPYEGNTFDGWYDKNDNLLSNEQVFMILATDDLTVTGKFSGSNLAYEDYLLEHGMDGTFETGTIDNMTFSDTWCSATVSDYIAYEGEKSLQLNHAHNASYVAFTGLEQNTDCYISFYLNFPEKVYETGQIAFVNFDGLDDGKTLQQNGWNMIKTNTGWYRFEFYVNTGANTGIRMRTLAKNDNWNGADLNRFVYIDNLSFYTYKAEDTLVNGDFSADASGWKGEGTVSSGTGHLQASGERLRQTVALDKQSAYTLSFRAKGNLRAGVSRLNVYSPTEADFLTSQSYQDTNSADWKNYSITFFSGVHSAAVLSFAALDGTAEVDDVVLTKLRDRDGAVVEKVDFETDRFALRDENTEVYSITDTVAHTGTKSLQFHADRAQSDTTYLLNEAYLSYGVQHKRFFDNELWIDTFGLSYHLSLYYKTAQNNDAVSVSVWHTGMDEDAQPTVTDADNGWKKVDYYFNNYEACFFKVLISNVANATVGDFYVDDITLEVVRPLVENPNIENTYCAEFNNLLDNGSFEQAVTDNDWKGLPSTAQVQTGGAAQGDRYLRVNAGTYYVLPVTTAMPNREYYLGVSLRAAAGSNAYIGVSATPDGRGLFNDFNGMASSFLRANSSSSDWQRLGTSFLIDDTMPTVYLVISCTSGYLDIDQVMLFQNWERFAYAEDPNNYDTADFDYDNIDPALVVTNGGFPGENTGGTNGGFPGENTGESNIIPDGDDPAPQTGESVALPMLALILALMATGLLLLYKPNKRTGKGGKTE